VDLLHGKGRSCRECNEKLMFVDQHEGQVTVPQRPVYFSLKFWEDEELENENLFRDFSGSDEEELGMVPWKRRGWFQ